MLEELCTAAFYKPDSIFGKLGKALRRDSLRHRVQGVQAVLHCLVDGFIIALDGGAGNAKVSHYSGVLISVKLPVNGCLWRLMLIVKDALWNTNQVSNP